MMRETLNFSINSDISSRISDSGELKRSAASRLTSSVLPTPVEPTKIKLTGLRLDCSPARLRLMAAHTAFTASSCPTMCALSRPARPERRSNSSARMFEAGIFVQSSMI